MKNIMLVLTCIIMLSSSKYTKELIVVVGDVNYPPYYYCINKNYSGFSVEVAQYIAEKMKFKLTFKRLPFARAITELKNGKADMITNFFISPERSDIVVFTSEPHIYESLYFFTKKGSQIKYNGEPQSLAKYKIGVVRGYSNGPYIDGHTDDFILDSVSGEKQQIEMLMNERHILSIGTKEVIKYHAEKMGVLHQIQFLEPPIHSDYVFMGFSKKRPDANFLADSFSEAIKEFKKTEIYHDLLNKYGITEVSN